VALREVGLLHALIYAAGKDGNRPTKPEDVISLDLYATRLTDASLKELTVFTNLTTLDVGANEITDAGLKELAAFAKLTKLELLGAEVTDAGMKRSRRPTRT